MSKDDGGPAFPTDSERQIGSTTWHMEGMTLRDYFAAAVMTGLIAERGLRQDDAKAPLKVFGVMSRVCYGIADAMLAERAKC